jgi:hypothetical protein
MQKKFFKKVVKMIQKSIIKHCWFSMPKYIFGSFEKNS